MFKWKPIWDSAVVENYTREYGHRVTVVFARFNIFKLRIEAVMASYIHEDCYGFSWREEETGKEITWPQSVHLKKIVRKQISKLESEEFIIDKKTRIQKLNKIG